MRRYAVIPEIKSHHPLVLRPRSETDETRFGDLAAVLFDQSLLAEGGQCAMNSQNDIVCALN